MKATFEYPLLEIILIQEEDNITTSSLPGFEDQTAGYNPDPDYKPPVDIPDLPEW